MTKTLRGFRFVIIVLGLLIFVSVVSARTERPFQDDDAAQHSPEIPGNVWGDAADKSYTTSAVNSAADILAPSFINSQPLTVTYTTSSNISMVDMDSDGGGYWLDEVKVYTPADRVSTIFLPMVVRLEENP